VSRCQKKSSGLYGAGKITEADTLTIRLDATPSGLISDPPPSSRIFTVDALPAATLPIYPGSEKAPNMLACIPSLNPKPIDAKFDKGDIIQQNDSTVGDFVANRERIILQFCLILIRFCDILLPRPNLFMVALCNRETIYIFMLWFVLLSFFSSPNLSGRRLDVYHTLAHGVALVRI